MVHLKEGDMVFTEDKRVLVIYFDLLENYAIDNSILGVETIKSGNGTTDVARYIESCRCDGVSFICNTDALATNTELMFCIKSVSPDVESDFRDSMVSTTIIFVCSSCSTLWLLFGVTWCNPVPFLIRFLLLHRLCPREQQT